MLFNEMWIVRDMHDGRAEGVLSRVTPEGEEKVFYQLSLEFGVVSRFPTIDLDRKQLKDLGEAIEMELYPERFQRRDK